LAGGKRVIVASSRGGIYSEGPAQAVDFQEPYLRHVFDFIGIHDVEFVRAEGLNLGPAQREAALAKAHGQINGGMQIAA
jgi:FMN-dependent NADH-azoreductase